MSEKEKMLNRDLYNATFDKTLIEERKKAKELCYEYNNIKPSDTKEKGTKLKEILGKVGKNCLIESSFVCDYGYNIEIGDNFFANHNLVILDCNNVKIGNNVFVGPNCGFYTAGHPIDVEKRNSFFEYAKPIEIGNNVWIGGNVVILPGVKIGDNTVIGAGSVVTKDIPSNVIAYGNPCKVSRKIDE